MARKSELPRAPARHSGPVKAWSEPVVIPTFLPMPPDRNPMFLEKRVYQGSSGSVYPLPFTDRISEQTVERTWKAICTWKTSFFGVMVLPEIGGRIHVGAGQDQRLRLHLPPERDQAGARRAGRTVDLRRHRVQLAAAPPPGDLHAGRHRISKSDADGSRTVWCSDHDPMTRMKGMHGVCLHPGQALSSN